MSLFKFLPVGKALLVSAFNQAVSSCTNFAMGLYLVRVLTPAEFGIYGIGIAVSLFFAGICNALFLVQLVVNTPHKDADERRPYAASMLATLMVFCLASLIVFVAGLKWSIWLVQYSPLALVIMAAFIAYIFKDFFIRYSYTAKKEIWALKINLMVAFSLLLLLIFHFFSKFAFTSELALWCYAISNLTGAVAGAVLTQLPLRSVKVNRMIADAREAWHEGLWAIGGSSVMWLQSQAYTYVTAMFLGPAGVGFANASRMLITPFLMLITAINQVTMPRLAELGQQSSEKMIRTGSLLTSAMIVAATLYVAIVITATDSLEALFFGGKYEGLTSLVIAWSIVLLMQLFRDGAGTLFQVMKQFRKMMQFNILSASVSVAATVVLMKAFGVVGAILGMGVGELLLALMLWSVILKGQRG